MRSFVRTIAVVLIALLIASVPRAASAEKRAFVVGINKHAGLPVLATAVADAEATAKTLQGMGFSVVTVADPDRGELDKRWAAHLSQLKPGDVSLVYFAGHGIQVDGANYLLPKDTPKITGGEAAILERGLNFHQLLEEVQARRPAMSLFVLDACRSNPFKSAGKSGSRLGQSKGLARIESVYGAFIMYSAGSGEEALDTLPGQSAGNSVYTRRLLPLLSMAELSLVDVAKRVQQQVEEDARTASHEQRPTYFDGIIGHYYLNRLDSAGGALGPADRIQGENVVRLGAFATWDSGCNSRPAPRIAVTTPPKLGRIVTRYETFNVSARHFGNSCDKGLQRGVGVYYVLDDANKESTAVDSVQFSVSHWSVAPVTTVNESFDIDLATRYSSRRTASGAAASSAAGKK